MSLLLLLLLSGPSAKLLPLPLATGATCSEEAAAEAAWSAAWENWLARTAAAAISNKEKEVDSFSPRAAVAEGAGDSRFSEIWVVLLPLFLLSSRRSSFPFGWSEQPSSSNTLVSKERYSHWRLSKGELPPPVSAEKNRFQKLLLLAVFLKSSSKWKADFLDLALLLKTLVRKGLSFPLSSPPQSPFKN